VYEVDDEDWEDVKARVRDQLVAAAQRGTPIYYSDITNRISEFEGPHSHALARMLGEISRESWKAEGVLLSAFAYLKYDHVPGTGFFDLAEELVPGFPEDEISRLTWWGRHIETVHRHYSQ
jgi:hypothetical protein